MDELLFKLQAMGDVLNGSNRRHETITLPTRLIHAPPNSQKSDKP